MISIFVVLGLAGSGKSTQSKLLAENHNYKWLSVGKLLRDKITGHLKEEMLTGKVLDETIVTSFVEPELKLNDADDHTIVLDGYPRGKEQADWLISKQQEGKLIIRAVVHIKTGEELAKERLLGRGRQDDNEQAIAERFLEYEHTIKPIIEEFKNNFVPVVAVNGEQSIEEVQNEILKSIRLQ
jgi:adenylate kinase